MRGALRRLGGNYGKPVAATLVVLALIVGGEIYARWHAATHVAPAVVSRAREHGRVDVIVRLAFRPELFHTVFFQKLGRLTGVQGQTVFLRDVAPAGVRRLGRQYWIQSVDVLPADGSGASLGQPDGTALGYARPFVPPGAGSLVGAMV